jgi:hypothetical protein
MNPTHSKSVFAKAKGDGNGKENLGRNACNGPRPVKSGLSMLGS